jgi:hypothetical protein
MSGSIPRGRSKPLATPKVETKPKAKKAKKAKQDAPAVEEVAGDTDLAK